MTDVLTDVLGFTLQTIGGNRNTWGNTNNNNFSLVEESVAGRLAITTSGGAITPLTQAQARKAFIDVSGALSSDATLTVPNKSKSWRIWNKTSGGFGLLVTTGSGTTVSVPPGTAKVIWCDGAGNVYREDQDEVGQMAFFGNSAVPNGWGEATGAAISRAGIGLDLFGKYATTWGVGNGATTFNLPDGYTAGRFLRSRTASVTVGTAQANQNLAHAHSGSTASTPLSLSISTGAAGAHSHSGTTGNDSPDHGHIIPYSVGNGSPAGFAAGGFGQGSTSAVSGVGTNGASSQHQHSFTTSSVSDHTHSVSTAGSSATTTLTIASDGGSEARPNNLSAILCVKY